jgi:hypothetical protein
MTSFADYLKYEPESIHWEDGDLLPGTPSLSTTSTKTTVPKNPRVDDLKVKSWRSFVANVNQFISNPPPSLANAVIKTPLPQDERYKNYRVHSEANVSLRLHDYVFVPLQKLFETQETTVSFDSPGGNCCLNPDYAILLSNWEDLHYALKSLIEVKTPWAFPSVPGGDLAAAFCQLQEGSNIKELVEKASISNKVIRAVTQLWGYMTVNHFRYGVLTTYLVTYFFRRAEVDGQSCLEISPAVRNKGGVVNIMGAWAYFISLLNQDPIYSSRFSTPEMKRRVIDQKLQDKYVPLGIALGDLYFEQKFSFGATGNVVLGRLRAMTSKSAYDDSTLYAMKLIDSTKVSNAIEIFCNEIEAYKRLEVLQGKVIPTFKGAFVASNFVYVIVLEKCGNRISKKELLPLLDMVHDRFKEIHTLGVVQGDVARRNILIHHGNPYIIDFGYSKFKDEGSNIFDELCSKELEQVSELLEQE